MRESVGPEGDIVFEDVSEKRRKESAKSADILKRGGFKKVSVSFWVKEKLTNSARSEMRRAGKPFDKFEPIEFKTLEDAKKRLSALNENMPYFVVDGEYYVVENGDIVEI